MLKKKVKQDMPIQVGCSVFDDSKLRMHQFYYHCIDKCISRDDFQYMYCNTDSGYMALTGEFESLIKPELKAEFEKERYGWFPREANREDKRKPGLFKVEFEGDGMIALCSKSYYVWRSGGKSKLSCKGVNRNRTPLAKEQYINCLTMNKFEKAINMDFRVDKKRIKTYTQEKIALTPIYTKGVVLN
jgi:superoxide dismutase